jgi:hypothetical protein
MSFVTEYLERRGVGYEVAEHPRALTSMAEARALGITADEVVKTVVLVTDRGTGAGGRARLPPARPAACPGGG